MVSPARRNAIATSNSASYPWRSDDHPPCAWRSAGPPAGWPSRSRVAGRVGADVNDPHVTARTLGRARADTPMRGNAHVIQSHGAA